MHVVMHFFHARLMREFNKVWVWVVLDAEYMSVTVQDADTYLSPQMDN